MVRETRTMAENHTSVQNQSDELDKLKSDQTSNGASPMKLNSSTKAGAKIHIIMRSI